MADEMKNGATAVLKAIAKLEAGMKSRFSEMRESMDRRFLVMETRLDGVDLRIASGLAESARSLDKVLSRLDAVDTLNERVTRSDTTTSERLGKLENRVDVIERELHKAG